MKRLKTISFQHVSKWLDRNKNRMTVFTMGGTSYLVVTRYSDDTICITGSTGITVRVDEQVWEHVMDYIRSVEKDEDTWKAKTYARPNIVAPELAELSNYGPAIPAICKAYWCYHRFKGFVR